MFISEHRHSNTHSPGLLLELNDIPSVFNQCQAPPLSFLPLGRLLHCTYSVHVNLQHDIVHSVLTRLLLWLSETFLRVSLCLYSLLYFTPTTAPLSTHHPPRTGQDVCWLVNFLKSLLPKFICLSSFQLHVHLPVMGRNSRWIYC